MVSPVEDQVRAFRTHIALSRETGKPLVVHVREAWEDAMRMLAEEQAERVVLHCFSGDEAIATEAVGRGYFISFAGNLTYPKTGGLRAAAAVVPEDSLLAETDSPFLTPQSKRGNANTPSNVLDVHAMLAETRGVNVERMVGSTTEAAMRAVPLVR